MISPRGAAASDHHIYLTTPYKAIITIRPLRQSQERCGPETLRVGALAYYGPVRPSRRSRPRRPRPRQRLRPRLPRRRRPRRRPRLRLSLVPRPRPSPRPRPPWRLHRHLRRRRRQRLRPSRRPSPPYRTTRRSRRAGKVPRSTLRRLTEVFSGHPEHISHPHDPFPSRKSYLVQNVQLAAVRH